MGLVKRTYVDGETVITAANLNDIQDEIIQNASDISTKGTYSKPTGGIPKTDLASSVQDSLDDADTAYQKPQAGIPDTDLASSVQTSLGKADTAYQKPSGGIPSTDMASAVQTSLGKADTAYQKPSGGIPSTDLASAVQTSLGKADTALQSSAIDNTLSVSGKAADAKKTGDEISDVKNTLNSAEYGLYPIGLNIPFALGSILSISGETESVASVWYRVHSTVSFVMDRTVNFVINAGFQCRFWEKKSDNSWENHGWKSESYSVSAKYGLRFDIRRSTEDESEIADIPSFIANLHYISEMQDEINALNVDVEEINDIAYEMRSATVGDGYDADEYTDAGTFTISSGLANNKYLHFPDGSHPSVDGGVIIVVKYSNNGNFVKQFFMSIDSTTMFTRYRQNGTFLPWLRIDLANELHYYKNILAKFSIDITSKSIRYVATATDPCVVTINGTYEGPGTSFANIIAYPADGNTGFSANKDYLIYYDFSVSDDQMFVELYSKNSSNVETMLAQANRTVVVRTPSDAVNFLLRIRCKSTNTFTNAKLKVGIFELNEISYGVSGISRPHLIQNKKIALFGDSIMSGTIKTPSTVQTHCCSKYMQDELKIQVIDHAIGGIGYIVQSSDAEHSISMNILELVKSVDLTGCTFFVCSAGDNDWQYPLGTYLDTNEGYDDYDTTSSGITIMGNIYKIVRYLHQTYTNMTVILVDKPNWTKETETSIFPTYRRTEGHSIQLLNAEIKKFCNYYGCGYIGLDTMGFDPWLMAQLIEPDQIHWTELGYQKLMLYISGGVRRFTGQGDYYINRINY